MYDSVYLYRKNVIEVYEETSTLNFCLVCVGRVWMSSCRMLWDGRIPGFLQRHTFFLFFSKSSLLVFFFFSTDYSSNYFNCSLRDLRSKRCNAF